MNIQILPARLANQIAAGEVVERPASVIKELVENSLDAQATSIKIDIEKGGVKSIRIADNGKGIAKEELTLALSRHATSKIKSLNDLESISSLGFRGEALASISSVSRLTLTSKPADQDQAWQACAEGRDMEVVVQPAAHPNGTTIAVNDLFFNTPARRKFLRTDKTEFTHIDELLRRIALANNQVSFVLTHNGKIIRQYRAANNEVQQRKRVAQICGQRFMDNAIAIECKHDNIHLTGWLASPDFSRPQNDLCYSYVNGRMMRDKLINHAIRQAYSEFMSSDVYPAFVLFLSLDYKEVDVNVHPAKHEVRFHQGRYVHDFIYSVCHKALTEHLITEPLAFSQETEVPEAIQYDDVQARDYIRPLSKVAEPASPRPSSRFASEHFTTHPSQQAQKNYQSLVTPYTETNPEISQASIEPISTTADNGLPVKLLALVQEQYALVELGTDLRLIDLTKLDAWYREQDITQKWQQGIVSQALLLPVKLNLNKEQNIFVTEKEGLLNLSGIKLQRLNANNVQVRQFPAMLRDKDVTQTCYAFIDALIALEKESPLNEVMCQKVLATLLMHSVYTIEIAQSLFICAQNVNSLAFSQQLGLNSTPLDLTSAISRLE